MTVLVLTRTLDEEIEALLAGEADCLVCGEPVEVAGERVECSGCGSVLEAPRADGEEQLALA